MYELKIYNLRLFFNNLSVLLLRLFVCIVANYFTYIFVILIKKISYNKRFVYNVSLLFILPVLYYLRKLSSKLY